MKSELRSFDMAALYSALETERRNRGLTWQQLTAEVDEPFRHVPSIPISISTITGMTRKRSVTSAVVLQLLRWLGRTPESFLKGAAAAGSAEESLPDVGPHRIMRFDTNLMHQALNEARLRQGLTWKQVADELPGFTQGMLTNLSTGPAIGFPRVMIITQWLERPAASFVRGYDW
jgi:hypothetical protein